MSLMCFIPIKLASLEVAGTNRGEIRRSSSCDRATSRPPHTKACLPGGYASPSPSFMTLI
eukprot:1711615-Amphidinium_carterae.1